MRKKIGFVLPLIMSMVLTACAQAAPSPVQNDPVNTGEENTNDKNENGESGEKDDVKEETDVTSNKEETPADEKTGEVDTPDSSKDWKQVYLEFLNEELDGISGCTTQEDYLGWSCGFIYLNDDEIPEMVVSSGYEAMGNFVVSAIDEQAQYIHSNRLGMQFVPRSGIIDNGDGHMGYSFDYVYELGDNGFTLIGQGEYSDDYNDEGYTGERTYSWDGVEVTKEEYWATVAKFCPVEDSWYIHQGTNLNFVRAYLAGGGANGYKEAYADLIGSGFGSDIGESAFPAYALVDRAGGDPLLIASDSDTYAFCTYSDGLLNIGPTWYWGSNDIMVVFPEEEMWETLSSYPDSNYDTFYKLDNGMLLVRTLSAEGSDFLGNLNVDENGDIIYEYKINNVPVSYEVYSDEACAYDESFKFEYAPYDAEETYGVTYVSLDAMLDMLK